MLPKPTPRKKELPRGIRNNNPLNIRIGNVWLGEVDNPTDPDFEQFVHIKYGLRAAFVLLRRYVRHYHRTTVPEIIHAWAPLSENNTLHYIDVVCERANICPDEILDYSDKAKMVALVSAMAFMECGGDIDVKVIEQAYDMA